MAKQNRTIILTEEERIEFEKDIYTLKSRVEFDDIENKVIQGNIYDVLQYLPDRFVDLLFVDPPYNINKKFNNNVFRKMVISEYAEYLESWLKPMIRLLKPTASIYICGDWRSSAAIHLVCEKYFKVRNRITFEREKGRGAKSNWKNNSEDIWFCTVSDKYYFNPEAVKLKRRVIAPYRENGKPKDWQEEGTDKFRLTYPSNIWTDITIPFWSMPENTPHPTQKPEKLLAKIILASSKEGNVVFDPFSGVGTTGVVAKKLNRKFVMVELEKEYCLYAVKRLKIAETDKTIQGYEDGVFWERNALQGRRQSKGGNTNLKKLF